MTHKATDTQTDTPQRRTALRVALGLAVGFVLVNGLGALMLHTPATRMLVASELWEAIRHASAHSEARVVIIGDSVSHQLYDSANESATGALHLTSNQATSVAGQEGLLRRVLQAGTRPQVVTLIYLPGSFANDLRNKFTYNYFVRPFCSWKDWPNVGPLARSRVLEHWEYVFAFLPAVKASRVFSSVDYTREGRSDDRPSDLLAPVSVESLRRIAQLGSEHGFALRIVSPPIREARRADFRALEREVLAADLSAVFGDYFDQVRVLPDAEFRDEVHLRIDRVSAYRRDFLGLRGRVERRHEDLSR